MNHELLYDTTKISSTRGPITVTTDSLQETIAKVGNQQKSVERQIATGPE